MMLATEVSYSSEIERMSVRRAPLPAYSPRSQPARIYGALWAEIREHLEGSAASGGTRREQPLPRE